MKKLEPKLAYRHPVWNPKRGSYGNNLWQGFSIKLNRRVKFYSDLEYHHWILVESNPDIKSFCEQPLKIHAHHEGKDGASIFDMWVLWRDGSAEYREIKYAKDLTKYGRPSVQRQITIQKSWCEIRGLKYVIFTDKEIYKNKLLLTNWKLILQQLVTNKDLKLDRQQNLIMSIVLKNSEITLGQIIANFELKRPIEVKTAVFRLLHMGKLSAPLGTHDLNKNLLIRIGHV